MSSGVFDSTHAFEHFFFVPDRVAAIADMVAWLRFREFAAPARAASASGELTSDSGGGSTSGASSASTSSGGGAHRHLMFEHDSASGAEFNLHNFLARGASGDDYTVQQHSGAVEDIYTRDTAAAHIHGIAHTHATPDHQHTTPAHDHGLAYGIFKEPMPATIEVEVGLWRRELSGGEWQLLATTTVTEEEVFLDLLDLAGDVEPGLFRLTLQSAPGAPNGGRLTADVAGYGLGAIAST